MQENPTDFSDPTNSNESCRKVPIERAHDLTPEIFYARYLTGAGKPVIITDELSTWSARSKWNFDFFKSRYGSDTVLPTVWPGTKYTKLMKPEDYIRPSNRRTEKPAAVWIDPENKISAH